MYNSLMLGLNVQPAYVYHYYRMLRCGTRTWAVTYLLTTLIPAILSVESRDQVIEIQAAAKRDHGLLFQACAVRG